jgi:nucleoside-diphosphate-sugar epimerase
MRRAVLVTGGAGYVGSILVQHLLTRDYDVRVLDSLLHGSLPSLLPAWGDNRFKFLHGDVRDPAARRTALAGVDSVVHLAAIVGDPACARDPDAAREVNADATRALLREAEAEGVRRFVFASTCSNYGKMADPDAFVTEEADLRPISVYAETKVAAELDVLERGPDGLAACCLRLATVYGTSPRMRFDLTVNEFTREVSLGKELVVFGEQFWRPYVHVRDAAGALALALEAPEEVIAGEVFNVGKTSENYRKLDLVELLRRRIPSAEISFVHKDEDPRDYRVGFEKVTEQLGFHTKRTVDEGIDEVIALLRAGLVSDPYAPVYRN